TVFFEHDLTFVVDASDRVLYTHFGRDNVDRGWFDVIRTELAPLTREMRGRAPERAPPTPGTIAKEIARAQLLPARPALVAAPLVARRNPPSASAEDLAAPLAVTVKFIADTVLHDIGAQLNLANLRKIGDEPILETEAVFALTDDAGHPIVNLAWMPKRLG